MNTSKGLYWLSSYPKSGNTWFRIFLANLLNLIKENKPMHINDVDRLINDHITTTRTWVNQMCGFDASHLTDDEIDVLIPGLYIDYNKQHTDISYHKIHRAYTTANNGQLLIPLDHCLGTIYFVRNPLDVAPSLANHFNFTIDDAINMMGDKSYALYYYPLRQWLLSWSLHVESWVQSKANTILFLRYEDMLLKPLETFTKAAEFLKLKVSVDLIEQAIFHSSFSKLKKFEDTIGFLDKPKALKHFFRKGIVGDWQAMLTPHQIAQIIQDHGDTMRKFGYLNQHNEPIIGY